MLMLLLCVVVVAVHVYGDVDDDGGVAAVVVYAAGYVDVYVTDDAYFAFRVYAVAGVAGYGHAAVVACDDGADGVVGVINDGDGVAVPADDCVDVGMYVDVIVWCCCCCCCCC